MVAAAALSAVSAPSLTLFVVGAAANLAANNKPLQAKTWLPSGGFIGVVNGKAPPKAASNGTATSKIHPIGGKTDKDPPPCPFGKFPKHKPGKLPGPPKAYSPAEYP